MNIKKAGDKIISFLDLTNIGSAPLILQALQRKFDENGSGKSIAGLLLFKIEGLIAKATFLSDLLSFLDLLYIISAVR